MADEEYKDIQPINLPIPKFEKDLTLVKFKAIFELMEAYSNDIIFNLEKAVEDFKALDTNTQDALQDTENYINDNFVNRNGSKAMLDDLDMNNHGIKRVDYLNALKILLDNKDLKDWLDKKLDKSGGTMSGSVDFGTKNITNFGSISGESATIGTIDSDSGDFEEATVETLDVANATINDGTIQNATVTNMTVGGTTYKDMFDLDGDLE